MVKRFLKNKNLLTLGDEDKGPLKKELTYQNNFSTLDFSKKPEVDLINMRYKPTSTIH